MIRSKVMTPIVLRMTKDCTTCDHEPCNHGLELGMCGYESEFNKLEAGTDCPVWKEFK